VVTTAHGASPSGASRVEQAWHILNDVLDPEVPALSVRDLGIVRDVRQGAQWLEVDLTPTYSGCPATEAIEQAVVDALNAAGLGPVQARTVLSPAWTDEGRRKLREYGIAPPGRVDSSLAGEKVIRFMPQGRALSPPDAVACPRCNSTHTERLSAFGSTACKSLHRCLACREPFEAFKTL
jgi:ring-1,2-phenylacetyl-CoA epoxidase subunit PaaD